MGSLAVRVFWQAFVKSLVTALHKAYRNVFIEIGSLYCPFFTLDLPGGSVECIKY